MVPEETFQATWATLADCLEELAIEVERAREEAQEDFDNFSVDELSEMSDDQFDYSLYIQRSKLADLDLFSESISELDECIRERTVERVRELFTALESDWKRSTVSGECTITRWGQQEETPLLKAIDPLEDIWKEITSSLAILSLSNPVIIFSLPTSIIIPKLVVSVQQALIDIIERDPRRIFSISSRQFEEVIAEVFAKRGFDVELTKQTRDGGRDIVAIGSSMGIRHKYLIECKRYAPSRNVSIAAVQRLYGVKIAERANKAILATTSGFTRDAREFAHQHIWDIDLRAYDDIMAWIKTYRC